MRDHRMHQVTQAEIDNLQKAARAAWEAGDSEHAKALEKSILFNTRLKREQEAGVQSSIAAFMEA